MRGRRLTTKAGRASPYPSFLNFVVQECDGRVVAVGA
jgi:hypothetical protein